MNLSFCFIEWSHFIKFLTYFLTIILFKAAVSNEWTTEHADSCPACREKLAILDLLWSWYRNIFKSKTPLIYGVFIILFLFPYFSLSLNYSPCFVWWRCKWCSVSVFDAKKDSFVTYMCHRFSLHACHNLLLTCPVTLIVTVPCGETFIVQPEMVFSIWRIK